MKVLGWIFIVIGGLSLIGAAVGGNSTFGPLFWLGLGIALVVIRNRKQNNDENKENRIRQDE